MNFVGITETRRHIWNKYHEMYKGESYSDGVDQKISRIVFANTKYNINIALSINAPARAWKTRVNIGLIILG